MVSDLGQLEMGRAGHQQLDGDQAPTLFLHCTSQGLCHTLTPPSPAGFHTQHPPLG